MRTLKIEYEAITQNKERKTVKIKEDVKTGYRYHNSYTEINS